MPLLTEDKGNVRMGRGDDRHPGRHHLLRHERCPLSIAIRRGNARRHENMRTQGESDQLFEVDERMVRHDVFETETPDFPKHGRLRVLVAGLALCVSDKMYLDPHPGAPRESRGVDDIFDALLLTKRPCEQDFKWLTRHQYSWSVWQAPYIDPERVDSNLLGWAAEPLETLLHYWAESQHSGGFQEHRRIPLFELVLIGLTNVSAVKTYDPGYTEDPLKRGVFGRAGAKVGVEKTGGKAPQSFPVAWVGAVPSNATPDAPSQAGGMARAPGIKVGEFIPIDKCVAKDDASVTRNASQMVVQPILRALDESRATL